MCFPVLNASSLLEVNFYSTAQFFIFFYKQKNHTHTKKKKNGGKKKEKKKCLPSYRPQTGHKYLQ